jgi:high-affinity iron transporter
MPSTAFFEAAMILLREGLEAILVLAALGAYLTRTGAGDRLKGLYIGGGVAVLASALVAWLLEVFNNGMHNDMIEAIVILFAAGLMFYVSGWLYLKQDPRAWQAYIQSQSDRVVETGSRWAIAVLAFLAVFREGAETALFLHATARTHGGWTTGVVGGIAAGFVGLAVLYVVINQSSRRLPLRSVFLFTSGFLFLMGLKFVGEAIQEFQEQALLGVHSAPAEQSLRAVGLNASWEAVGVQAAILLIAAAGMVLMRRGRGAAGA